MYHIRTSTEAGNVYAKTELMEHGARLVVEFPKLAQFLQWFPERDQALTHDELSRTAYEILPEKQFPTLAEFLAGKTFDKEAAKWKFYLTSIRRLSLYLRPILLTAPFTFYKENGQFMEFVKLLKTHYASGKSPSCIAIT